MEGSVDGIEKEDTVEERAMSLTLFTGEGIVIMYHSVLCPTHTKTKTICEKLGLESRNWLKIVQVVGILFFFLDRDAIFPLPSLPVWR